MLSFLRITTSGRIIPGIEGLRFIGIVTVVAYHLNVFIRAKDLNNYLQPVNLDLLNNIALRGYFAVEQFFVLSGFILAVPFAKTYLQDGAPVGLGDYYYRRLTRIEPPYMLVMTLLLLAGLMWMKNMQAGELFRSYASSMLYIHNIHPGELSRLNPVTWSLEIEIQFYLVAPLAGLLFKIKNSGIRRMVLLAFSLAGVLWLDKLPLPFISLVNYIEYFLTGFLLADLFLAPRDRTGYGSSRNNLLALLCFAGIWLLAVDKLYPKADRPVQDMVQLGLVFILYYLILVKGAWSFLRTKLITIIGGMCYTIYLLHYPLISAIGNPLMQVRFSETALINKTIYVLILITGIVLCSITFYLIIERPCMEKDWPRKLLRRWKAH